MQRIISVLVILKTWENKETEIIGSVTPTLAPVVYIKILTVEMETELLLLAYTSTDFMTRR